MKLFVLGAALMLGFWIQAQSTTESFTERNENWIADLDFLVSKIKSEHYRYTHTISPEEFDRRVDDLRESIPQMSELEIIGSFMKLLAAIGDGHTLLYPPFKGNYTFKALPLEFYLFGEDLYIRAATTEYADLVGTRVIQVGEISIKTLLESCAAYIGHDNEQQLKWILPVALMFSDIYALTGASRNRDKVHFTLMAADGTTFKSEVISGPLMRDPLGRFAPSNWAEMRDQNTALWTKDPDNYFWFQYLEEIQVVYFQFNQVRNKEEQSLAEFSKELFRFINEHDVDALILDIRLNNGGNSFLNRALIHEIIKCDKINQKGKLFTIIGRRTFSAAMNFASDMERHTNTLFIGEPTGSSPNFYGEDNEFVLPNSGLVGSISSRYWQGGETSDDNRPWIAPDLPAELTAEQYINNLDSALEAILNHLQTEP